MISSLAPQLYADLAQTNLAFVKIGGSLLTDKTTQNTFRPAAAAAVAADLRAALAADPSLRVLVGHGGGSFGHFAAKHHNIAAGVHTPAAWQGFAQVNQAMTTLTHLLLDTFAQHHIAALHLQPSASASARDGMLQSLAISPIAKGLHNQLVPIVYGDVVFDTVRGGTIISTEQLFFYLAQHLPVRRILLLGEVAGVYDADGAVIPEITPHNFSAIEHALGGSRGVDVTGGMETKVRDMLSLAVQHPALHIRIIDGRQPDLLRQAFGGAPIGTLIHKGEA
jgi:isopentenyl phosphate kinase